MGEGLRISGGSHRGRRLPKALEGIRPTAGRVREAYFNIVGTSLEGSSFLDLFSGSGLMSLEAISRGASPVHAVEIDRQAARKIDETAEKLGLSMEVFNGSVFDFLADSTREFDLIYADPPWKFDQWGRLIEAISQSRCTGAATVVSIEHPSRGDPDLERSVFGSCETRRWGDTAITFLERGAPE